MASDSLAWFEFLLNPALLESHLNQSNPEPSAIGLIIQFIYNSIKRSDGGNVELETMDLTAQENTKKKNALSVLALKTAAHLKWNLEIFEQKLPLHMQDALLVALLAETGEEMSTPSLHGTLDTGPLLPYQLFSLALYHRYALRALVQAKLPAKPVKVSNVPIPGQQDPTQESREVQEGILSVLDRGADVSVRVLEQLLGAGEVRAPVMATFTVHTHQSSAVSHLWERCQLVADEQFKCQIHYDLGAYHFLQERYEDGYSHFAEAYKLMSELGPQPEYCQVNIDKLKGYYSSCASLCGRSTPLEKRSLYDRFLYSLGNGYQVQTLNTIRCVLEGESWNSGYPLHLAQSGKSGVQFLIQALAAKFSKFNNSHKERLRMFIMAVSIASDISETLIPAIRACPPIKALFSQEELLLMWPKYEESHQVYQSDPNSLNDIIWELIHSYNPEVLKNAVMLYKTTLPPRQDIPKKEIPELNTKWEMPIPIYNTLMKLPQTPQRELVFLCIAKAVELAQAKSFRSSLSLLEEASSHAAKLPGRETGRLCKLLIWMLLMTKIQHCIHELPCVDSNVMSELTSEARQCLSAHSGRDGIAPWTGVNNWCILLLLNAGEWGSLLGGISLPSHIYLLGLVKPLAATAHALREKHTSKTVWYDLWDVVVGIIANSSQHKRSSSGQSLSMERHHDSVVMSRSAFLDFLENLREPSCLSILISLLGHVLNLLNQEPSSEIHIDHLAMWPQTVSGNGLKDKVKDTLTWLVDHATRLYPTGTHTSAALCTSWHLSRADLAYMSDQYHNALAGYLTAVFVATDFLRNDNGVDQSVLTDSIIRRMIRCCMNLNCYTQATILCQFLENIDYCTALRCLQERSAVDAMDAYYCCLWDVSLIEFIINMHHKRGEVQRRDKALKMMGLLEVNSNNNDEIQREAAKVRKHRFLRSMAKQYL
ncbi:hypothetical protein O3P69_002074 [Scylla paramamosain]|uniref:INTS8 TPR repeats domain-containing protein n=1 Tax=Scylla paramamosain TaxID=85552 RepID=A0AAW0V7V8_SCYPA